MKRYFWICSFAVILTACGAVDPNEARFTGTWQHKVENGLTNAKEETVVTVAANHERFRIEEKTPLEDVLTVYDGHTLFSVDLTSAPAAPQGVVPDAPIPADNPALLPKESNQPMTVTQTGSMRFWALALKPGHGEPGGPIAGRDTHVYKSTSHRSDGDFVLQEWVDDKTGLLLKSISSTTAAQMQTPLHLEMWECQAIDDQPPNEALFQKPQ